MYSCRRCNTVDVVLLLVVDVTDLHLEVDF